VKLNSRLYLISSSGYVDPFLRAPWFYSVLFNDHSASACFPTHDITRSFPYVELMFAQCTTYKMSAVAFATYLLVGACFRSNRFTSTKSPSFCLTIFGGSLTKLTALLRPSHVLSYHVNRRIRAPAPPSPPPHFFQKQLYTRTRLRTPSHLVTLA
jgi:hypothetical protein